MPRHKGGSENISVFINTPNRFALNSNESSQNNAIFHRQIPQLQNVIFEPFSVQSNVLQSTKSGISHHHQFRNLRQSLDLTKLNENIKIQLNNEQNGASFDKGLDRVINDQKMLKGYQDVARGKDNGNIERFQIFQQDFEFKLGKMNQQLEKEMVKMSSADDDPQMIPRRNVIFKHVSEVYPIDNKIEKHTSIIVRNDQIEEDGQNKEAQLIKVAEQFKNGKNIVIQMSLNRCKKYLQEQVIDKVQLEINDSQEGKRPNTPDEEKELRRKMEEIIKAFRLDVQSNQYDNLQITNSQTSLHRSVSPQQIFQVQDQREKTVKILTNGIKEKNNFYEVCKNYASPAMIENCIKDPKFNYFIKCNKELVLALPALAKIHNKTLVLSGYKLNSGVCKALKKGLRLVKNIMTKIIIDNNGIHDKMTKSILKGIEAQDDFKSIIIKRNEIDKLSMPILTNLLQRQFPRHLEELRIVNCKIHQSSTLTILQTLKERSQLRKLGLVKASLSEICIPILNEYISQSRSLIDLDISWNELRSQSIKTLLETLSKNRSLQYLNLSWNNLQNSGSDNIDKESQFIIDCLSRFIKYNRNLLHLDLSYTRLTEKVIMGLGACLKKSKTLIGIHFTGNPGVTKCAKEFIYTRIKCKSLKQDDAYIANHSILQSISDSNNRNNQVIEGMQLKQIFDKKKIQNTLSQISNPLDEDNKLDFHRWLGHKVDLPGSGQWQMLTQPNQNCWICNKWIYSLVFWNKSIGFQDESNATMNEISAISSMIEQNSSDPYLIKYPQIAGSFSNWSLQQMTPIHQFCMELDPTYEDPLIILKKQGKIRNEIKNESELTKPESEYLRKSRESLKDIYRTHWKDYIAKFTKYKKVQFVNVQFLEQIDSKEDLFVYACFMQPGKEFYAVKTKSQDLIMDEEVEWFTHKCLIPIREEEIVIYEKENKFTSVKRVFRKETSVFKDWKEDNSQSLNQCLEEDFKFWKIFRFIKEEPDRLRCDKIIRDNVVFLKRTFMSEASCSGFPNISWIHFSNFCEKCKIFDKNVILATIDRIFIATNVELEKMDENPDKALCRFEFFEILVRIAQSKYKDPNICNTFSESLEKLLRECIFPYAGPEPWQEFRDKELWTLDVNDILEANLEGLKKVYSHYWEPRKKYMTMQDALNLFMKDTSVNLIEKDAIFCYGMCKMTIIQESENGSQYKQLKFVELLEMIGRVAHLKFQGTEIENSPLAKKIEFILDQVLILVDTQRKDVHIQVDEHSESDDEY